MDLCFGSCFSLVNTHRPINNSFNCDEVVITDQFNNTITISFYTEPGYRVELIHSQDKLGMDGECIHEYTEPCVTKITVPSYVEEEDWF